MNAGEWSEFYAFLKLLADGQLYGADANLAQVDEWRYPVKSIVRENDSRDLLRFVVHHGQALVRIECINRPTQPAIDIMQADILQAAQELLAHDVLPIFGAV